MNITHNLINEQSIPFLLVDASTKEGHEFHEAMASLGVHVRKVVGNGQAFLKVTTEHEASEEIRINTERNAAMLDQLQKNDVLIRRACGLDKEPATQEQSRPQLSDYHQKLLDQSVIDDAYTKWKEPICTGEVDVPNYAGFVFTAGWEAASIKCQKQIDDMLRDMTAQPTTEAAAPQS